MDRGFVEEFLGFLEVRCPGVSSVLVYVLPGVLVVLNELIRKIGWVAGGGGYGLVGRNN